MKEELLKEISDLLSDSKLNWDKCNRLSVLYGALQSIFLIEGIKIPKDEKTSYNSTQNALDKELNDILPALSEYLRIKDEYRQGHTTETAVIHCAEKLTVEINEFITALKAHATETERQIFTRIK